MRTSLQERSCSQRLAWFAPGPAAGGGSSPCPDAAAFADAAQHEMTHCIEVDRAQLQGMFDGMAYFREREGLRQPCHLNVLAAAMLL